MTAISLLSDFRFPTSVPPRTGPKQSNRNAGLGDLEFWEEMQYFSGWGSWWQPKTGSRINFGTLSGCLGRSLSFNRTQSRAFTGLLTGLNTLRRHLHLIGLSDSPLCRRYGAEDEISVHILCECEALATLRHVYLGSFFLEPEDVKSIILGANWNFSNATGLP